MSDLVSRIDSRIREIQGLLGEQEVSKGKSSKNTGRVAFDMELGKEAERVALGSLPGIGDLKVLGLRDQQLPVSPFKPESLRSIGADAKAEALSSILDAESELGSNKPSGLSGLLPTRPFSRRSNAVRDLLGLQSSRLPGTGPGSFARSEALERALEAYKSGQGPAKPKTEEKPLITR